LIYFTNMQNDWGVSGSEEWRRNNIRVVEACAMAYIVLIMWRIFVETYIKETNITFSRAASHVNSISFCLHSDCVKVRLYIFTFISPEILKIKITLYSAHDCR
jgi:hypothetical protein